MSNPTNPPIQPALLPGFTDSSPLLAESLSEGPWVTLVMILLACVALVLLTAGGFAGGT